MPVHTTVRNLLKWLLTSIIILFLLIAVSIMIAPRLLTTPSVKAKIQAAVTGQTGGQLDYQKIELSFFPRPAVELQQVSLNVPNQARGIIAILRISPKFFPLLAGNLHLSQVELIAPELSLEIPDVQAGKVPAQSSSSTIWEEGLTKITGSLGQKLSGLKIQVNNGQVTINQGKQKVVRITGITLKSSILLLHDELTVTLEQLGLSDPTLELTGNLVLASTKPAIMLNLSAGKIDVDATRKTVMALTDDTSPAGVIFDYLRGGQVPQISFSSHGENLAELGSLNNILIKGQLQDGKVSIPQIDMDLTEVIGDVTINKGVLHGTHLSTRLKKSTGQNGSLQIGLTEDNNLFQLELSLDADLAELQPILQRVIDSPDFTKEMKKITNLQGNAHGRLTLGNSLADINAKVEVTKLKLSADYQRPPLPIPISQGQSPSTGTVQDLPNETKLLQDTINVTGGGFTIDTQLLTLNQLQINSRDAEVTLSGSLKGFPKQLDRMELTVDGRMGPQSVELVWDTFELPKTYAIHTPLTISNTQISWQPNHNISSIQGMFSIANGPAVTADIDYHPGQLQVHQLTIKDQYSDADMVFDLNNDQRDFKFTGKLEPETLQTLFVDNTFSNSRLEGDLAVSIPQAEQATTVKGQLTGENLPLLLPSGDQVDIDQITLQGDGQGIKADIAQMTWEGLTWKPVKAAVAFNHDGADIRIIEAKLCGIDSPGTMSTKGDDVSLDMVLAGQDLDVATSYTCLTKGRVRMTGTLNFSSTITSKGHKDKLIKGLQGPLQMTFKNGVVQENKLLSRTLEVLNVTEIIKGRLPNLNSEEFAYSTMTLQGEFKNGKLLIDKYFMDGETLDLLGQGEINLHERTVDMQLLAAPFQTVDTIVKHIPGINYLLAGSLVSIPVSINGPLTDPKVNVLSVSAVSSSLFNLAKRTIKSPFKLIDALNPWSTKNKE